MRRLADPRGLSRGIPVLVLTLAGLISLAGFLTGCRQVAPDPNTVVVEIESSPTNLDPRIGTDAQSEWIDELIFDSLVKKNAQFDLEPDLAASWDTPNPLTYIFHLRHGVTFQDGQPFTSRDVKWTLDSMRNGTLRTAKYQAYRNISSVNTPDPYTVVLKLSQPDASLLWNLSDGGLGIVPYGSGKDFARNPVGTGPFRLVSQEMDRNVVLERNPRSWQGVPAIHRVIFRVVPDATTRALELRKGSADVAVNGLTPDMNWSLRKDPNLIIAIAPGTKVQYLAFNLRNRYLRDVQVRRAIAYAINRPRIISTLLRGEARIADTLLPPGHWAAATDLTRYAYDPAKARELLDQAGYKAGPRGIRFRLDMKTSNDAGTRLFAMALQQQLRAVGIALDIRSFEFATFYSDISRGAFGLYALRWIGGNENPDIFRYAYATSSFPPHGANRGHYSNPEVDRLLEDASMESDESKRRADYVRVQEILADDLPALPLWFIDSVAIYNRRLTGVQPSPSGGFYFLETAIPHPAR
jgi:peptide/nickel transport system substrate-binding protein